MVVDDAVLTVACRAVSDPLLGQSERRTRSYLAISILFLELRSLSAVGSPLQDAERQRFRIPYLASSDSSLHIRHFIYLRRLRLRADEADNMSMQNRQVGDAKGRLVTVFHGAAANA